MFFPNSPPHQGPRAPQAWTSRTTQEPSAAPVAPEFPSLPDLAPAVLSHLRGASVMGLCYLYEVLTPVEDQLYSPTCRPIYREFEGEQTAEKAPFVAGELLDKISELRMAVADELFSRPTPLEERPREYRAKVLMDWHFRSNHMDALKGLPELVRGL